MKPIAAILAAVALAIAGLSTAHAQSAGELAYQQNCWGSGCHTQTPGPNRPAGYAPSPSTGTSVAKIKAASLKDSGMKNLVDLLDNATLQKIADYIVAFNGGGGGGGGGGRLTMTTSLSFDPQPLRTASANRRITVTNSGTASVTVSSVTSNNSEFRVVGNTCATVAVSGTCAIDVNFRPEDVGTRGGTISIVSNGTGSPQGVSARGEGLAESSPPPGGTTVTIYEAFHAAFGHYFITANADEMGKITSNPLSGWAATGRSFKAYQSGGTGTAAVCRFFTTAFAPKSSHFYAPRGAGCEPVFENKDWQFEADAFYVAEANDAGACPTGTQPIYRLYNNGQTGAPNHRYTNDPAVRSQMMAQGFVPEGKGAEGVGFCAPL